MKKTSILVLSILSLCSSAIAAEDTIKDNWTTANTIATETNVEQDERLPLNLHWEILKEDWNVKVKLKVKDLNLGIQWGNFSINVPIWLEFVSIEKGEILWKEDLVEGNVENWILAIEFFSEGIKENNWELFVLTFIEIEERDHLFEINAEADNEILTDSELSFKFSNIEFEETSENFSGVKNENVENDSWKIKNELKKETVDVKTGVEDYKYLLLMLLLLIATTSVIINKKIKTK